MRVFLIIFVILMVVAVVFNIYYYNTAFSFSSAVNRPYVIGLLAAMCGILMALVMYSYMRLKKKVSR